MKRKQRDNGRTRQGQGGAAAVSDEVRRGPEDTGYAESDAMVESNPELESTVRRQLELLSEDPEREGLRLTPARVARSLCWLTKGYRTCVEDVVGTGLFRSEGHRNMIMVR